MIYQKRGFTLIEILIAVGIFAILVAGVTVAINPVRQFQQARDAQRWSNVGAILNAVVQNMVDNRGSFNCVSSIPSVPTNLSNAVGDYNICSCLVPNYLASMPFDPSEGSFASCSVYDANYEISQDGTTGRITVSAPTAEIGAISITR